jgi:DNA ligase-associated metallophosphoesterase
VTALLKPKSPASEIEVGGAAATLDISGALYLATADVLVVSDLHLEKGSCFARTGQFLPPYDTRETLALLADALARYRPRRVVALGDSFHDVDGPARLADEDRATLRALQAGRDWTWVLGNHDPALPSDLGGEVLEELEVDGLRLRHTPAEAPAPGEVAGHLHPVGKVAMRGRSVRRRCFVTDGSRLVMPAFGAYAGGLNACDAAFKPLFPGGFTAHLMGDGRIFAIGRPMLCRD